MKLVGFVFLIILFCNSKAQTAPTKVESSALTEKSQSSDQWVLSASDYKQIKANGASLRKSGFWEFDSLTQLETENSEAMIFSPNRFYFKLFPNTLIQWKGSLILLHRGRVYFKFQNSEYTLQIPGLFKFNPVAGDFSVSHDDKSKVTDFEIISPIQKIQIDSDDRQIPGPDGTKLTFIPEFIEGEMAFDFLLNDRKIPRMKMEQTQLNSPIALDINSWKQPLKKAADVKKKAKEAAKAESGIFICKLPKGKLNSCAYVREGQHCVRYSCNLSGMWTLRTEFSKNEFCPKTKSVKECEWLGQ